MVYLYIVYLSMVYTQTATRPHEARKGPPSGGQWSATSGSVDYYRFSGQKRAHWGLEAGTDAREVTVVSRTAPNIAFVGVCLSKLWRRSA
jgi:hypothetical protein